MRNSDLRNFNTWKGPEGDRKLSCDLCGMDDT